MFKLRSIDTTHAYTVDSLPVLLRKLEKESNPLKKSKIYSVIGSIYLRSSQLDESLNFKVQALMSRKTSTNYVAIAESYNDVGVVYQKLKSYQEALVYYEESWKYLIKSKVDPWYSVEQAILCKNLGSLYYATRQWNKSKNFYIKAKDIATNCLGKKEIAAILYNLGIILIQQKNCRLAHDYFSQALGQYKQIKKENVMQALCKKRMADIHFIKKEYEESQFLYQESHASLIEQYPHDSSHAISQIKKIQMNLKQSYWNQLKVQPLIS